MSAARGERGPRWPRRVRRAGLVAAAALLPAAAPLALADGVDSSRPYTLVVGAPRGFAPSERLDARRTGRSPARLPFPAQEAWRKQLRGGIDTAPLADPRGDLVVALTVPEVVKLGADGRERWRVRIGDSAPLAPAVITSDGTLALITSSGFVWGLTPAGGVRFAVPLGVRGRDADVTPLALDDGGLVAAAGRALVELTPDGSVRARAEIAERATGALLAGPEGTLVTTESGAVLSWRPPSAPRQLGALGGTPRRGAALADARTLLAVVDGRRLVALDLPTGTTSVRSGTPFGALDGPPAVGARGVAFVLSSAGLLLGVDAAGNEAIRIAVDRPPPAPPPDAGLSALLGPADVKPSPPVVIDRDGRVGFARAGGRAGVVDANGSVSVAAERVCSTPVAVVPAGEERMAVACRDGTVVMLAR
ncbi:hypothetical protein SOCE26_071900 [Sorangium cellulosum]|uniref:Secreted protein n=1 Tax=Sorangium cellulosum TaxID=56 RepID=A0A2L0F2B2_SORCE|nr:PQQ-binding-like beta-propeller repeat protein [Sorangium cellulosum]AUX45694.1 hypothetical protein SOCE26_071900 [Sorangium cellulosum]